MSFQEGTDRTGVPGQRGATSTANGRRWSLVKTSRVFPLGLRTSLPCRMQEQLDYSPRSWTYANNTLLDCFCSSPDEHCPACETRRSRTFFFLSCVGLVQRWKSTCTDVGADKRRFRKGPPLVELRERKGGLRFCLTTQTKRRKWILPRGWKSPRQA